MVVVYSYLFVFGIIGVSTVLTKLHVLNDEGGRKFIHIGVGNWIIIAYFLFDNIWMSILPPLSFVILNYISYRFNLIKAMERDNQTSGDLGTVYYALSLFIVVLLDFLLFEEIKLSLFPILVMTYGDGLSAIIGSAFPSKKLYNNKTVYGAVTMFVVTLVLAVILIHTWWIIILVSVASALIELFSPRGFDNITVPLILYGLIALL